MPANLPPEYIEAELRFRAAKSPEEKLEILLKKKFLSEYLYDDVLALEHAYKNFELKTLISNVFPDMIRVSGSKSGKMIIKKGKEAFEAYSYIEGKSKKIRTQSFTLSESFLTQLKNSRDVLLLTKMSETNPVIHQKMLELKVECIVPFIYKNKLFGFLGISGIPNEQAINDLKLLASKAAIAVFNHTLTSQVAILNRFKQEMEIASKIQGHVFHTIIPRFVTLNIEIVERDPNIILEFFRNSDREIAMVLVSLSNQNLTSGLVLAYVLGKLQALKSPTSRNSHKSLSKFLDQVFSELNLKDSYESLVGIYDEVTKTITLSQIGTHFKAMNEDKEGRFSVNWKHSMKFNILHIYHKKKLILKIQTRQSNL
ncbi:MAG: hypothetical protein N3A69_16145 [Leptospiraceae bacterium]|nr:hypothetical protein [Leptospiraceae bacterium]